MKYLMFSVVLVLGMLFVLTQGESKLNNRSGHDIIDGNCSKTSYNDRVYYDHVNKMAFPLVVRSETANYTGNRVIYCIQAMNQKNNETGGSANITQGGVGYKFAVIKLESFRGHGLEYYVSIFARNITNATTAEDRMVPAMAENLLNLN